MKKAFIPFTTLALRFAAALSFAVALGLPVAALAASLTLTLNDQDGAPVEDAVIYIATIDGEHQPARPQTVEVDQVNEMFVPHVRATTVGSLVIFPNSDHVRHHVYSFSEAKTFEVPLYSGVPAEPTLFDKAGIVTLGCNIHDHMLGYVLVLDTPWFAEVRGGSGRIDGLPAGRLAIEIWHPRLAGDAPLQRNLEVSADENATLVEQVELRPERTVRRAPRRGSGRY
jgi:plastocyanin